VSTPGGGGDANTRGDDGSARGDGAAPAEGAPGGPPRGTHAMAIVRWGLVLATMTVAALSIAGYARSRHGGGGATAGAGAGAHAIQYHCPMHPSVVRDRPGECPICGMTLVPFTDGDDAPGAKGAASAPAGARNVPGLAAVDLDPTRVQLIGMRTAVARHESLGGELRVVGAVAASERSLAQITTRFAGWVQKLAVAETGVRVHRGQVLASIYSPDVLRAEQELLVAHGWAAGEKTVDKTGEKTTGDTSAPAHVHDSLTRGIDADARRRLELLGVSAPEIDALLRAGKPSDTVDLRSPVDGYVVAKNAVAGLAVQPGTVLFEVADLSRVWVTADVAERDIARVRVGQTARFEPTAFPGEMQAGRVQLVSPVLDAENRTLRLRLELKNRFDASGPRLRPGMYGTVHLDLPATTGLMVPAEALVDTGEARYVFVATGGGHFEPRRVQTGARAGDRVEILGGLADGETVVTTGNFLLDSESRLRAAVEGRVRPER
jgi:Cu(I)/Ag(I) efflux system membrane fusion protein